MVASEMASTVIADRVWIGVFLGSKGRRGCARIMRIVNLNDRSYSWPREMTMHDKPVALVTGANKGIGLQIAKDLATRGFTVLVGSRNLDHGKTAAKSVGAD